jgi:hypothetical protein
VRVFLIPTNQQGMKSIIGGLVFISGFSFANAQDRLVLRTGSEISVQIADTGAGLIRYKRFDNLQGPIYAALRKDVARIVYRDGTIEAIAPVQVEKQIPIEIKLRYGGPRIGFTYLSPGESTDRMNDVFDRNINPFITQFGWQFETRFFTLDNGASGLLELVPMIGGLEQGLFIPSITGLVGYRSKKGYEIGVGPTLSLGGAGILIAAGASLKSGRIVFPVNLAFVPSVTKSYQSVTTEENIYNPVTGMYELVKKTTPAHTEHTGFRITLTLGFNSRSK